MRRQTCVCPAERVEFLGDEKSQLPQLRRPLGVTRCHSHDGHPTTHGCTADVSLPPFSERINPSPLLHASISALSTALSCSSEPSSGEHSSGDPSGPPIFVYKIYPTDRPNDNQVPTGGDSGIGQEILSSRSCSTAIGKMTWA